MKTIREKMWDTCFYDLKEKQDKEIEKLKAEVERLKEYEHDHDVLVRIRNEGIEKSRY